ncbi:MAG: hypothetical protein J0H83_07630 [Candidatus Melainabacteria bacterium]|nr:hypothetical protein [Candidatus Melainabacteria bacterium]MBX9673988.1 hypothetical protein [Candidatus Obscuribacterales bacterium]
MQHRLARPTIKKIGRGIALACSLASLALTCAMPVKADPALKSNSALQDLLQELNYRQANLTKRLKEAIDAKRIDPEPAQQFQKSLLDIENKEVQAREADDRLNLYELETILFSQDELFKTLEASLKPREAGSLDIERRYQELKRRVDFAFRANRLTQSERDKFQNDLDGIYGADTKNGPGDIKVLTVSELLAAQTKLDAFSKLLTSTVKDRQFSHTVFAEAVNDLDQRVDALLKDKKISKSKAAAFKRDLAQCLKDEDALRKTKAILSADEQLGLSRPLSQLESKLDLIAPVTPQQLTVGIIKNRLDQIRQEIVQGLLLGTIELKNVLDYQNQLDGFEQKLIQGKADDTTISKEDSQDLEHLLSQLRQINAENNFRWQGILELIRDLSVRLADAEKNHRLDKKVGDDLTARLDDIKKTLGIDNWQEARKQGRLKNIEAVKDAGQSLVDLNLALQLSLKSRDQIKVPDADVKLQKLDQSISTSLLEGKLSASSATSLMQQLSRIYDLKARLLDNNSMTEDNKAYLLAVQEESLSNQLAKALKESQTKSSTSDIKASSDSLRAKTRALDEYISAGTISGALKPKEIQDARERIARAMAALNNANGLDAQKTYLAAQELENVKRSLAEHKEDNLGALPDLQKKESDVYKRITEAVLMGMLAPDQADLLKKDFYRILDKETQSRATGGLSFGETATLIIDLEKLEARIDEKKIANDATAQDVDKLQRELEESMAQALIQGRLNILEAEQLSHDLDRISRDKISVKFKDSATAAQETTVLANRLVGLRDQLQAIVKDRPTKYKTLEDKLAAIESKIDSLPANLSDLKKRSQADLGNIARQKELYESSGGGLSLAEASSLLRDCQRMEESISRSSLSAVKASNDKNDKKKKR